MYERASVDARVCVVERESVRQREIWCGGRKIERGVSERQ